MSTLARGSVLGMGAQRLVVEECGECFVLFAFPETQQEKARADHRRGFWCPNEHKLHYTGKTEAQKLREQLERERDRAGRLASQRDQAEASLRATKGVVTRQKKQLQRVANGVCPCCNRSFVNLARHMESKHPGYQHGD